MDYRLAILPLTICTYAGLWLAQNVETRRLLNINNASPGNTRQARRKAINRWAFNKMQITGRRSIIAVSGK